jgi:poly(3-hydroxyalkanoate) depolymerase
VWGREQVVEVAGMPLRVVRKGSGMRLLLINGIGAPAEMWQPFVARLEGHAVVALDLPGTGGTPPPSRPLRMRGLAGMVTGLLDALGWSSCDVLGYSFGGIVAQELARRSPERVDRLVLCATTSGLGTVPPNPLAGLLMLTPMRYYNRAVAVRTVPLIVGGRTRRDPLALEENLRQRLAKPPSALGYLHQLYAVTGWTSTHWIRRVQHRTLIIHGDEDPLVPVVNARRMAAAMPNAQLAVVPRAGHLLLLDEPDSVIGDLAEFLALPAPTRSATCRCRR